ncbi:hypothetical protein EK21DRAFT_94936 [Setomelanomma holmii]|uniref:Rhodopsin domain-containing protein n=1 Tax=Setomelanomma holmii TaxID=210430 RepID=A0A9P4GXP7_9PLEO|nr:hypothetical protein EK21DRAFT_94936 [Setomelanomma holmii]
MGLTIPDVDALAALPPSALAQIPGEAPPPGVVPNFAHPASNVPLILGLSYFFFAVSAICFLLRVWTRAVIVKRWQWDDITITAGYIFAIVHLVVTTRGCLYGGTGKHQYEIGLNILLSKQGLQQSYVTVIVGTPALGLIKMSLLIQYYLLFNVRRYIRISVWIAGVIFSVYYVSVTITAFVLNSPWNGESLLHTIVSWHYLKFAEFAIPTGVIGMVFDWFLFFLPMPAVWSLHLNISRKIGILLIFATGGVGAVASIVSLHYRVQIQNDMSDVTWKVGFVLLWSQIEMFAGVTASCMPTVRQFFSRQELLKSWGSSLRRSIIRSSTRSSSNAEQLPAHVATLREYESKKPKNGGNQNEKSGNGDLEAGHGSNATLTRDSASSLGKDDASASLQSVSIDSYR